MTEKSCLAFASFLSLLIYFNLMQRKVKLNKSKELSSLTSHSLHSNSFNFKETKPCFRSFHSLHYVSFLLIKWNEGNEQYDDGFLLIQSNNRPFTAFSFN